ncbi:hypothetical protein FB451DRAFT_1180264 [Mycena latifolia]|nr:hypothetical protein FB451DRAFT_1180264 [Mycena latifolia]
MRERKELEAAFQKSQEALKLHSDLPQHVWNSAIHLRSRFMRLGDLPDLEAALQRRTSHSRSLRTSVGASNEWRTERAQNEEDGKHEGGFTGPPPHEIAAVSLADTSASRGVQSLSGSRLDGGYAHPSFTAVSSSRRDSAAVATCSENCVVASSAITTVKARNAPRPGERRWYRRNKLLPQNCDPVVQYLKGQATAFHYLGEMKYAIGEYPAAQLYAEAFYKLSESARDLFAQAAALQILASDHQNSVFLCQRAIKFLELGGITSGRAYDVLMLDQAEAHVLKSEYAEARRIHTQIVPDTTNQTAAKYAWGLLSIAQLDIITGANTQDVYLNLHKAKELFNSKGFMHPVKYCDLRLAELHLREGETLTAQGIFQTCFNSSWGNDAQAVLLCMKGLANVSSWPTSDFNQATRWPIIYLGYAKQLANKCAVYEALQLLGDVVQAQGDSVTSMTLYTLALEGFTCMDIHRSRAECMLRLADLANSQGDTSKAIELWTLARPLFERSSQVKQVSQVDERLATVTQTALEEQTETLRTY